VSYEVRIIRSAEKEMDKLPEAVFNRISKRIISLEDNPRPRGIKKLSDRKRE
jgi:mRNA-degrading endonuclease RelE of RelBE toxin-antitoxin system